MGGLQVLGRTYRHLNRYREVAAILARHGFGDLLHSLKIEDGERPERVRLALQDLGPTFIKAAQYLSTRADLLPEAYLRELVKLQDRVPPFPAATARRMIEEDLGGPIGSFFARFDDRPLAAASIAQIHTAALPDGREVVVKVRRPDIRRVVSVDLEIMKRQASMAEKHIAGWDRFKPTKVVAEIGRSLERELDFAQEAAHTERFARQFAGNAGVVVPLVHRALSSPRVLTLERVRGVKISGPAALEKAGLDPRLAADALARHYLEMIFIHGFFHADPHPGNLFLQPDYAVAYVDFGMVGRLDRDTREGLADAIYAVSQRDQAALSRALLALAEREEEPDSRLFEGDMGELMDQYAYRPLTEWRLGRMLEQLFQATARHGVRVPAELYLVVKALTELESLSRTLDPNFDVISAAIPYVRRVREERVSPGRLAERAADAGRETVDLLASAPSELRELIKQARRGRLLIEFEHKGLGPYLRELDQVSNRLAYAIVLASLVIGSALMMQAGVPPHWRGISVLGLGGFTLSTLMGFRLLLAITRHNRL